jgi:hypothetical protein
MVYGRVLVGWNENNDFKNTSSFLSVTFLIDLAEISY